MDAPLAIEQRKRLNEKFDRRVRQRQFATQSEPANWSQKIFKPSRTHNQTTVSRTRSARSNILSVDDSGDGNLKNIRVAAVSRLESALPA